MWKVPGTVLLQRRGGVASSSIHFVRASSTSCVAAAAGGGGTISSLNGNKTTKRNNYSATATATVASTAPAASNRVWSYSYSYSSAASSAPIITTSTSSSPLSTTTKRHQSTTNKPGDNGQEEEEQLATLLAGEALMAGDGYFGKILNANVYDVAIETELQHAKNLSKHLNNTILLKREDTQPVFSFKIRGAYNKMASLPPQERSRGVVACSAGNHAQGVALSARMLGCRAVICMPLATPSIKVNAVREHGGETVEVRLVGNNYDEAATEAMRLEIEEGLALIHPFDDEHVIAGQGTIGECISNVFVVVV